MNPLTNMVIKIGEDLKFCLIYKNIYEKKKKIECNLFYIAWGTKDFENHKNIKIDRITRKKIIKTKIIERPEFGVFSKLLLESLI